MRSRLPLQDFVYLRLAEGMVRAYLVGDRVGHGARADPAPDQAEAGPRVDPPGQRALAELLARLPQAKILVTHDVESARILANRAVFFEKGRIAGEGSVEEMIARFSWDRATLKRPTTSHF